MPISITHYRESANGKKAVTVIFLENWDKEITVKSPVESKLYQQCVVNQLFNHIGHLKTTCKVMRLNKKDDVLTVQTEPLFFNAEKTLQFTTMEINLRLQIAYLNTQDVTKHKQKEPEPHSPTEEEFLELREPPSPPLIKNIEIKNPIIKRTAPIPIPKNPKHSLLYKAALNRNVKFKASSLDHPISCTETSRLTLSSRSP